MLITMDVCTHAVFRREHLQMLAHHDSPVSSYLVKAIEPWLELNRKVFFREKGFFRRDVVAAVSLIDKNLFDENLCTFSIQQTGLPSGKINNFQRIDSRQTTEGVVPVNVPLKLDTARFMQLFLDGLLKF